MAEVNNRQLITIVTHASVTLYALCFWVQVGTLPYLTKQLDVDPITFGYLQTTFAAVQLMGGPLFGRFGDLYGSKHALLLAFFASFLTYLILGLAQTVFMLFLSRMPSLCMHAMQGAQMVITDISDENSRSDQLGRLGLSYGVGMVLGPLLGGQIIKHAGEQSAAFVSAFGSVLAFFLIYLLLPGTTKGVPTASAKSDSAKSKGTIFDFSHIVKIASQNVKVKALLLIKSVSGIPIGVLHSMFGVLALNHFKLTAEVNGYVLSYIGIVSMVSQGLIVGRITKMGFDEWFILKGSISIICVAYLLLLTIVYEVITFCIALFPMVVAGAIFTTVMNGMLTKSVTSENTGTMLGVSMAVNSLIRIVGPTLGGLLLEKFGFEAFGVLGVIFNFPLILYITFGL